MSRKKKRFSELPTSSKVLVVVGAVIQFALQGAAVRDLKRRPAAEINGPKALWGAVSFINFIGPLAYFVVGRKRP